MAAREPRPLASRGLDSFYVFYVAFQCVFPFLIDFTPYYPVDKSHWSLRFYEWTQVGIDDPLFARHDEYTWLAMYTALEVVYLVPHGLWCIRCLIRDDRLAAFHLLVWSGYLVQSCLVCIAEIWGRGARDWPAESIAKTLPGYLVFTAIGIGMFLDSALRVRTMLLQKEKTA